MAALTGSRLAPNPVQKGYDLISAGGEKIEVRYLANPAEAWINEHLVQFTGELDFYALVVFEAFEPIAVLIFPRVTLSAVCEHLGKRHPNQDQMLQFTRSNFQSILRDREGFARLGVKVLLG